MKETITKHAESLGRDAEFEKTIKINRLPAYLTVQLVRFFFKEKKSVGAKVLKVRGRFLLFSSAPLWKMKISNQIFASSIQWNQLDILNPIIFKNTFDFFVLGRLIDWLIDFFFYSVFGGFLW